MGSMRATVVVEGDPPPDAGSCLRAGLPGVQVDAFILQGAPEAIYEDVVQAPALAVHRDPGADPLQSVGPGEGRELAAPVFMISGEPNLWIASSSASTQKSASNVFEMRQARTLRVNQCKCWIKIPHFTGLGVSPC